MIGNRSSNQHSVDSRIFRNSAARTKLINIAPKIMRGGIRL